MGGRNRRHGTPSRISSDVRRRRRVGIVGPYREGIGMMRGVELRRAHLARAEQGLQPRECLRELLRIAQAAVEQVGLLGLRPHGTGGQFQPDDGGGRCEIFQVRVEHAEEQVHLARGLRNGEDAPVRFVALEMEHQPQFARDEIGAAPAAPRFVPETGAAKKEAALASRPDNRDRPPRRKIPAA